MDMQIIELKQDIIRDNEITAGGLRNEMKDGAKLMINIMSAPGSGKTSTLIRTIHELEGLARVGVMECDIDASVDAEAIANAGGKAVQLHTGGMCHMDADMTKQGLDALGIDDVDVIFIENVGNLVCPAEFDTGAALNVTILSVPEGDDKPSKYTLMYKVCDAVLINKIDALKVFDFDIEAAKQRIHKCNPDADVFCISAKTGEGFNDWTNWLKEKMTQFAAGSLPVSAFERHEAEENK